MENKELIQLINRQLNSGFADSTPVDNLHQQLSAHINDLINSDFNRLVNLLYKIDVDENRLKNILKENPDKNTGSIIANLIIERQLQKLESRKKYK